jgi:NlpC/P60 family putative phage cell wall peptidase
MALERDETLLEAALRHLHTVDEARPGDAMLFRWRAHLPARHVGIVVAPGMMVHAQEGARVCEVTLSPWWLRHAAGCFAFPGTVR